MNIRNAQELVEFARQAAEEETIWADWHNRVFGINGKFAELFPAERERIAFFDSTFSVEIDKITKSLRQGRTLAEYTVPATTASERFPVRVPSSLHEALVTEAHAEGVSLNQLIVAKLAISLRTRMREAFLTAPSAAPAAEAST